MTDYEVYDKFFSDEEYELENAPAELYSYRSGWNTALKRASIVIRDEIRPHGEWIDHWDNGYVECPFCHKQITGGDLNFCVKCGADLRGEEK